LTLPAHGGRARRLGVRPGAARCSWRSRAPHSPPNALRVLYLMSDIWVERAHLHGGFV